MLVGTVNSEDKWQIQNDAETLLRAREIANDEKRLEKVKAFFKDHEEAVKDLSGDEFYEKLIGLR